MFAVESATVTVLDLAINFSSHWLCSDCTAHSATCDDAASSKMLTGIKPFWRCHWWWEIASCCNLRLHLGRRCKSPSARDSSDNRGHSRLKTGGHKIRELRSVASLFVEDVLLPQHPGTSSCRAVWLGPRPSPWSCDLIWHFPGPHGGSSQLEVAMMCIDKILWSLTLPLASNEAYAGFLGTKANLPISGLKTRRPQLLWRLTAAPTGCGVLRRVKHKRGRH